MSRRRRRFRFSLNALAIQLSAFALSFTLVALLVVSSSHAAFVDQSQNVLNHVTSTSIDLTDDDGGTAMFPDEQGLTPGTPVDRCITVTYDGNVDTKPVMLYAAATSGALAPYLQLTIEVGAATGNAFGGCTGFSAGKVLYTGTLSGFATAHAGYASALQTWDPAGAGEARTFRFELSVQDDPAASGASATFGFTWEARAS